MRRLSERIRQARESSDLSRAELARRVGVKPSAAVQWELKNGTVPNAANLAKVATLTDVAFEWLATGRGTTRVSAMNETPAVHLASFAHNLFEERLLEIARILPSKTRDSLMHFLEDIVVQPKRSSKRRIDSDT
jgi:transcriptional regulator with XRE-family HTH domain